MNWLKIPKIPYNALKKNSNMWKYQTYGILKKKHRIFIMIYIKKCIRYISSNTVTYTSYCISLFNISSIVNYLPLAAAGWTGIFKVKQTYISERGKMPYKEKYKKKWIKGYYKHTLLGYTECWFLCVRLFEQVFQLFVRWFHLKKLNIGK